MVGFIFNHDVFDEPYKQTAAKWLDKLATYVESLNEKPFFTFGNRRGSLMGPDMDDEYIIVQHTIDLTAEQKQTLVSYIKEKAQPKGCAFVLFSGSVDQRLQRWQAERTGMRSGWRIQVSIRELCPTV